MRFLLMHRMVESRYMHLLCQVKNGLFNILDGFFTGF